MIILIGLFMIIPSIVINQLRKAKNLIFNKKNSLFTLISFFLFLNFHLYLHLYFQFRDSISRQVESSNQINKRENKSQLSTLLLYSSVILFLNYTINTTQYIYYLKVCFLLFSPNVHLHRLN